MMTARQIRKFHDDLTKLLIAAEGDDLLEIVKRIIDQRDKLQIAMREIKGMAVMWALDLDAPMEKETSLIAYGRKTSSRTAHILASNYYYLCGLKISPAYLRWQQKFSERLAGSLNEDAKLCGTCYKIEKARNR